MADTSSAESPLAGKIVTIFGSSKPKDGSKEYDDAKLIGERLASAGTSICSGGYRGIMEAVSRGASSSGVKVIGVTSAVFSPSPNEFVNVQVHTKSLYERLEKLVELADGYIVLKGGTGTLVEFAMVWELMNKRMIVERPIIAVTDYWKPIIELLDQELASEGMESCGKYVKIARDASEAAQMMIDVLSAN